MVNTLGPLPVSERLEALWNSSDVKLLVDGEDWGVTGMNFQLKDGRLTATAFAVPPFVTETEEEDEAEELKNRDTEEYTPDYWQGYLETRLVFLVENPDEFVLECGYSEDDEDEMLVLRSLVVTIVREQRSRYGETRAHVGYRFRPVDTTHSAADETLRQNLKVLGATFRR